MFIFFEIDNCAEKNKNKMEDLDELIELEGSDVD